ncbi:hypothetical protein NKOR_04735 [Candidatus Nitrosopumilus koreensis AR1]|uniref:Uncharacterized protein n=2 Tax=Nitrosopumilaceae TaxID=338190 RepID=K0B410_9ARCH|nr:hypothetical protein NKOR_04735 [Candidatus Nitrosopumilus koreensis AR1]
MHNTQISPKTNPTKSLKIRQTLDFRFMAEKKPAKKGTKAKATKAKTTKSKTPKAKATKAKTTKSKTPKAKATKAKTTKSKKKEEPVGDMGIVIVDDDIEIDQEKVNEERRAYLEEARSQEAFD